MKTNTIIQGDCLEESQKIKSGSVDLILTDLPYGTVGESMIESSGKYKIITQSKWDNIISTDKIMEIANRILRKNGKMVLTANQPFTTDLISKQIPTLPHCYNMYWDKMHFANCLSANKAPVGYIEDVLIFSKNYDQEGLHPLREYFKKVIAFIGLNLKQINNKLGHRRAEHTFYINSTQYGLCTEQTYTELIDNFGINKMNGFKPFQELKGVDSIFSSTFSSTFNLWEGNKYKSNILKYKKDYNGYHPTQKPLLLLEDLIKTFSNKNDLVVDLTMGSGSTCVAAIQTGRRYIGIEKEPKYFKIARQRITQAQPTLF